MFLLKLFEQGARDVRYGTRLLLRSPLFSTVAVTSLAIGIGGTIAIFTVMNAALLRTLPVWSADQLFIATKVTVGETHGRYSWPAVREIRAELQPKAEIAAFTTPAPLLVRVASGKDAEAERVGVQLVSDDFFAMFRQGAQIGRVLSGDLHTGGDARTAVISDRMWQRRFNRSPDAVGTRLTVNGASFTIVGVAERMFFGPVVSFRNPDIWLPLTAQHEIRYSMNASFTTPAEPGRPWITQDLIEWLNVMVRVSDSNAVPLVADRFTAHHHRSELARADSDDNERRNAVPRERVILVAGATGLSTVGPALEGPLYVLLGMAAILLLVASGNLAGLLLSRGTSRGREISVRLSLGATRSRVMRQLLAETLLLAMTGGCLGLLAAAWGRDLLVTLVAGNAVADLDVRFDWRVVVAVALLTLATTVVAGLLPAARATRVPVAEAIKGQGRAVGAARQRNTSVGRLLVAGQIALCLVSLSMAALFTRSLQSLLAVDLGYDREALLVAAVDVRGMDLSADQRLALYARVIDRLRAVPGVSSASFSMNGPVSGGERTTTLTVEGYSPPPGKQLTTNEELVTPTYFETVGLRIVEGRSFRPSDLDAKPAVTVINSSMARRLFPSGAVGKRWDQGESITATSPVIIGVVEDASYRSPRSVVPNMVYQLVTRSPANVVRSLEVRTTLPPGQLVGPVRRMLADAEPALPLFDLGTLDTRVARSVSSETLVARLTSAFGALALCLACVGLYGTVSFGVAHRTREIGLRMALGSKRRDILALMMKQAGLVVLLGTAVGAPLTYAAARGVGAMLYGAGSADVTAYVMATFALTTVAGTAAFLPAYRASRIDPATVLRAE